MITSPAEPRSRSRRDSLRLPSRRPLSGTGRVWLFTAGLAGTALAIYLLAIRDLPPVTAPFEIPWWILAAMFFLAETKVVHFHFRRDAHSFSLNEIPFVLGLFFVGPRWFLLAYLVGAGAALRFHRHQSLLKLAFNLSQFWLGGAVALTIVHTVGIFRGEPGPIEWVATLLAVVVANTIGAVAIALAISLSEGTPQFGKLPDTLRLSTVVAATNGSLALLAVAVLWNNPQAAWLFGIPITTLFLAYRAYLSERQKRDNLELVYESTRILQRTPELDMAIVALLRHAQATFRAERAELMLYPRPDRREALRTVVGPGDELGLMMPFELDPEHPVYGRIRDGTDPQLLSARAAGAGSSIDGIRDAMICPLLGESGLIGVIVVANRLGDISIFNTEDLKVFETIANHVAIALENGQLEQSLSKLTELKEELRHQADHDPLTGLANRTLFGQAVEARLFQLADNDPGPAVLFMDLDDFKFVNDSLGHSVGDLLLVEVAARLQACIRAGDLAARLGGDEFGILLPQGGLGQQASVVGDRIMEALRPAFVLHGKAVNVSGSVGIALTHGPTMGAAELLRNADVAMYAAKARGKSSVAIFEPEMHEAVMQRRGLGLDLRQALAQEELTLLYQPIVDIRTGRPVGAEALLRWHHPERGLILPAAFIPIAEETGSILQIGRWVLFEACRQAERWGHGLADAQRPYVTVNVSSRQIQHPEFLGDLREALLISQLDPARLVLEVTEATLLQDTDATISKLETIVGHGIRIAVDDFGTGYSSLSRLHRFPVRLLKIAYEFVDRVDRDPEGMAFTRAIVALSRALGVSVIAEGIERTEQVDRLIELDCELGQGYLFARPLEAGGIERLFEAAPSPVLTADALRTPRPVRTVLGPGLRQSGPAPH